ncbi:thiamine pyrophosphate-dependent enzyme [Flavobacterium bizetiae]|uniref:thiamine pyrophosphate-dependent enzyme n=1 Tax=Flavobacterium bizetiae TaxID=2704140 RepID=UPI0021E789BA|nr:thiamine pyrophosphate-dependent enzyme [Flavobacterium bizetiae]UTN03292.1 thiamine pyrophosphate-dependent enzyme [Flavobacterium bizetiae]
MNSNKLIIDTLQSWGVSFYSGVTGGGVIHYLKYIDPYTNNTLSGTKFLNFGEYNAGFVPLGYYLASGKIAAAIATTGAATKLISCGLSDAKLHDIPAVYIVPVSGISAVGFSPLQDSTPHGSNIILQLEAELPGSVFVLDSQLTLPMKLAQAKNQLDHSKPVVLVLDNEQLIIEHDEIPNLIIDQNLDNKEEIDTESFIDNFRKEIKGRRLVVLVGEEMARYHNAQELTSKFAQQFQVAMVWSINGANAVDRNNPYGYGYISFGGNDRALSLFNSLNESDVLLILGACPDEYTVNFNKFSTGSTFFAGNIPDAYGLVDNSVAHFVQGRYYHFQGPLNTLLESLIVSSSQNPFRNIPAKLAPQNLNDKPFNVARENYVDMSNLYQQLDQWWPENSIGFDDVCLAYKDRQYVTQRPNNNIRFYSLYRGSAMGGAFGAAVGAKISNREKLVFLFTGDGCFRLFSGTMAEVSDLGLIIFLLNNKTLGIVEQGLTKIMPGVKKERYHAELKSIDYCGVAKAHGWDAEYLNPDLSNIKSLFDRMTDKKQLSRSLLIEVPVDALQLLGSNPRLKNL